jgi:hypothetical protein
MADRRFTDLLDESAIEEVLHRAEDLLARNRHRGGETTLPPSPPADLPTLTEVDGEAEGDGAAEDESATRRSDRALEVGNLRLEILAQLAPVLDRLVEAQVVEHLGPLAARIAQSVKEQLEREIKAIVGGAIDKALLSEVERVESARKRI